MWSKRVPWEVGREVRTGGNRTCDWEEGVFGTGSGGCPVTRGAPDLWSDGYSEKQKPPHQALGFTI